MTREEAKEIFINHGFIKVDHGDSVCTFFDGDKWREACIVISGWLKQEPVLDKIRAEIHATAEMHEDGYYYLRDEWIDEIFDKYKSESEVEDGLHT